MELPSWWPVCIQVIWWDLHFTDGKGKRLNLTENGRGVPNIWKGPEYIHRLEKDRGKYGK